MKINFKNCKLNFNCKLITGETNQKKINLSLLNDINKFVLEI